MAWKDLKLNENLFENSSTLITAYRLPHNPQSDKGCCKLLLLLVVVVVVVVLLVLLL